MFFTANQKQETVMAGGHGCFNLYIFPKYDKI